MEDGLIYGFSWSKNTVIRLTVNVRLSDMLELFDDCFPVLDLEPTKNDGFL